MEEDNTKYPNFDEVMSDSAGPGFWYIPTKEKILQTKYGDLYWNEDYHLVTSNQKVLAILEMYCRFKPISDSKFIVWFEPAIKTKEAIQSHIKIKLIEANQMNVIENVRKAKKIMKKNKIRFYHDGGEIAELKIPYCLPEGKRSFDIPDGFKLLKEILILADQIPKEKLAVYSIKPNENQIDVIPQDWFNNGDWDFGYQWPTRVARDPISGRLFCEGIRIGKIVLDSTGRQIETWIRNITPEHLLKKHNTTTLAIDRNKIYPHHHKD